MGRLVLALLCAALTVPGHAQNANSRSELEAMLSFEAEHGGTSPRGWGGGPPGTIFVDGEIVHGGRWSVRLERAATSPSAFSTITKSLPMDFAGGRIEWRGFLRTDGVSDYVGLWMRQDGDRPGLAFDNMQQRQVKGTHDWTEYSITLPVHRDAKQLYFGVLIAGTGKVWADDLQLLVDGKPVWDAPKIERPKTPIDLDHEFDGGSGIVLSQLTKAQIENLALLGKVWGFLKYHHQRVIAGKHHWDYELFRVLPKLLAARDRAGRPRRGERLGPRPGESAGVRRVCHPAERQPARAPGHRTGSAMKPCWGTIWPGFCAPFIAIDPAASSSTSRRPLALEIRCSSTSSPTRG